MLVHEHPCLLCVKGQLDSMASTPCSEFSCPQLITSNLLPSINYRQLLTVNALPAINYRQVITVDELPLTNYRQLITGT